MLQLEQNSRHNINVWNCFLKLRPALRMQKKSEKPREAPGRGKIGSSDLPQNTDYILTQSSTKKKLLKISQNLLSLEQSSDLPYSAPNETEESELPRA